jgi:hypothetical protein
MNWLVYIVISDNIFYSMNKIILSVLFLLPLLGLSQPALYFYNAQTNEVITAKPGHQLVLMYKGYNGQTEFYKEIITEISDSTITLGHDYTKTNNFTSISHSKKAHKKGPAYKVIAIKDIMAFRRISPARILSKAGLQIGSVIGLLFLVEDIYESPDINSTNAFFLSFSLGIASRTIINIIFPEDVKHYMNEGWKVINVYPQLTR